MTDSPDAPVDVAVDPVEVDTDAVPPADAAVPDEDDNPDLLAGEDVDLDLADDEDGDL